MKNHKTQLHFPFLDDHPTHLEMIRRGQIPDEFQGDKTCYLIHSKTPVGSEKHSARHYVGICDDLKRRWRQHRRGNKTQCAMTAAFKEQKAKYDIVMKWEGVNRKFERYIKSWKRHALFCPECQDVPFF